MKDSAEIKMKSCYVCGSKPHTEFYRDASQWDGLESLCKICRREKDKGRKRARNKSKARQYNRNYNYGVTQDKFQSMWEEQNGKCAIGGEELIVDKVCIDHNHVTGAIRGLTCSKHNSGLGMFNDDPEMLRKAILYLELSPKLQK